MISVQGVCQRFGDHEVLSEIDLEVPEGETLGVMGSSGGGKTTLLRCISGLLRPTSGRISVAGVDVLAHPDQAREAMGMVFQSAALFDFMNVRRNVRFGLERMRHLDRNEAEDRVTSSLRTVGLDGTDTLMPAELSGGMRKRVGIARALVLRPKVILYDEPTTGLDPITAYTIDRLIAQVKEELGATSLVVSHDVNSVFRVADRIAFLEHGRITFLGSPQEFRESKNEAILEMLAIADAEDLALELSHSD